MKGIILAGGSGSRLMPASKAISKQLIPVYDKPMIYYPMSSVIGAGIRDILIISTARDLPAIERLFGNGEKLGLSISYALQDEPRGIAEAFVIGKNFIGNDKVCLILGDNIFYGKSLEEKLLSAQSFNQGGQVFAYYVKDPERYGVAEFDKNKNVLSIEEKPKKPKSNWAVTGIYFYDNQVVSIAEGLKPSARGELEITDVNKAYLEQGALGVELLGRGVAWLDAGTPDSLFKSSMFVQSVEERQGLKIGCIEEAAFCRGFISAEKLHELALEHKNSNYGAYLEKVANEQGSL